MHFLFLLYGVRLTIFSCDSNHLRNKLNPDPGKFHLQRFRFHKTFSALVLDLGKDNMFLQNNMYRLQRELEDWWERMLRRMRPKVVKATEIQ
jgi:hypothetical protein